MALIIDVFQICYDFRRQCKDIISSGPESQRLYNVSLADDPYRLGFYVLLIMIFEFSCLIFSRLQYKNVLDLYIKTSLRRLCNVIKSKK